jgi:hypothetical protein
MPAFVIYDPGTGNIKAAMTCTADQKDAIALNTPAGSAALEVAPDAPAIANQTAWKVQNGALVAK